MITAGIGSDKIYSSSKSKTDWSTLCLIDSGGFSRYSEDGAKIMIKHAGREILHKQITMKHL